MIARSGLDGDNINNFFELNNGCICCTVKQDLLLTLEQLTLHKDRFDYIIIETTGVANPGPIISMFWADEGLESSLFLDGVVCVVDCVNFLSHYADSSTNNDVSMQISFADRILLNKSDAASAEQVSIL
jgi:G3E family GTPase